MTTSNTFASALKQRRKALDLTQQELARQVGCAVVTIQRIEQGTLRPSRQIAQRLADSLKIDADERELFVRLGRIGSQADTLGSNLQANQPTGTSVRAPLPVPLTPLIGRERERLALREAFADGTVRLITLTGPGGTGKTRLAIQVATDIAASFADGAVFIELAPISDPDLVLARIAQAFAVNDLGGQPLLVGLQRFLRDKHLLLVLDNFEQVLTAAAAIAELLTATPRIQLLITSRVVIGVYGEYVFPVSPLPLPILNESPRRGELLQNESVRLFVERARAASPHGRLSAADLRAVSEICHYLDGLPLALELAAVRVRLMSPQVLLQHFAQNLFSRLQLLTDGARTLPARQQTLRATLAWSYDLLDPYEQQLFRRLAVFVGGWTAEAAAELLKNEVHGLRDRTIDVGRSPQLAVFEGLAKLLDTSLIQRMESSDGEPRFMMLETIREYALEQLAANGELSVLQQCHAAFFLALVEAGPDYLAADKRQLWFERLDQELPNLRAALAWSCTEVDGTTGLRLMVALDSFWSRRSHMSEQRRWLTEVLTAHAGQAARPDAAGHKSLRAAALQQLGNRAAWQNDLAAARPALEESLALYRELEDTRKTAAVLRELGMMFVLGGNYEQSAAVLEESLRLVHQIGDSSGLAYNCFFSGALAYGQGNLTGAEERWDAGLTIFRQLREPWMIATSLVHLGIVALDWGDHRRAERYLAESLQLLQELGDRWQTTLALEVCAGLVAARENQPPDAEHAGRRAAEVYGAAETLREMLGAPLLRLYHDHRQRGVAAARARLDPVSFDAAWAAGRTLTLEQAVAYVLEVVPAEIIGSTSRLD